MGSNGSYLPLAPLAERKLSPQVAVRGGGGLFAENVRGLREAIARCHHRAALLGFEVLIPSPLNMLKDTYDHSGY